VHGRGIHSGKECALALSPAPADHGVRFFRAGTRGAAKPIAASIDRVSAKALSRQTVLCAPDDPTVTVETVEHVLAALHGMGVDNVRVEMTGPEPPILDGSAAEVARAIARAGVSPIPGSQARFFTIDRPVIFTPDGADRVEYSAWPSEFLTITYFLEYDHPFIGSQAATFRLEPEVFLAEIAPARTFCLREEIAALLDGGLAKGGQIDNVIVIGDDGPMNTSLRWDNEPARHKLLDLAGDLYLLGSRVRGHIVSWRGGHRTHHQLIHFLRKEFPLYD
jgi:UDP-3-O-acyl N-acetylglucosamine deacetylase